MSRRNLTLSLVAGLVTWAIPGVGRAQSADSWPYGLRLDDLVIHADFPLQSIQQQLQELGDLRQQLAQRLRHEIPARPVHIYLFAERTTYHNYVRRQFPSAPLRPALYIGTAANDCLLAAQGPELLVDLRHELTHSLLHRSWPHLPLWLDEGLAEYFEMADAADHRSAERWRGMARSGQFPHADRLWSEDQPDRLRREDYELAYAWTRFLLESPQVDPAVVPRLLAGETAASGSQGPFRRATDRRSGIRAQPVGWPSGGLSAQLLRPLTGRCQQFWAAADPPAGSPTAAANYNTSETRRPQSP